VTNLVQNNSFETVAGPGPPWFADPAEPAHAPHWTKTDPTWPAPVVANDTFLGVALPGLNVTNLAEVGPVGPSAAPQGLVGDLFTATTPGSTYLVYAYVARGTVQGSALTFQARLRNHAGGAESAVIAHKTMPLPSAPNWELMSGALALSGSYDRVVLRLFTDTDNGTFAYTVNGISQTKAITREVFGPLPSCTFGAQPNLALATNYQDLWWNAPGGSESGWGINLAHEGDTIFATWFTYDHDRTPMWLVATAPKTAPGTYMGTLYRLTGPPFNAAPFPPMGSLGGATGTRVGTATFTFSDGNTGTFAYTVNAETQMKNITRELFQPPAGTVCQ